MFEKMQQDNDVILARQVEVGIFDVTLQKLGIAAGMQPRPNDAVRARYFGRP